VKSFPFPGIAIENMKTMDWQVSFGSQLPIEYVSVVDKCLKTLNTPKRENEFSAGVKENTIRNLTQPYI
jgi:hypothetical protein